MTEERRNEKDGRRGMGRLFGPVRAVGNWLAGGNGRARPGKDWTAILPGGVKLEMVWVEPGTFMMGSAKYSDTERPVHRVTLTKGYWIGKHQFTQEQWQAVGASKFEMCCFRGYRLPVEMVNWYEATDCCRQLNALLMCKINVGYHFALPTETQWEFAARGGVKSHGYEYSGDNNLENVAWYYGKSNSCTHNVGQKRPNELGIYDMSGNVWEWCCDCFGGYPSEAVSDSSGPSSSGLIRVCRGGAWNYDDYYCRSTCRHYDESSSYSPSVGFRVALVPSE